MRSVAAPNIVFHSENGVLKDGGDRQELAAFSQRISDEIQINDERAVSKSMLKDLDRLEKLAEKVCHRGRLPRKELARFVPLKLVVHHRRNHRSMKTKSEEWIHCVEP